MSRSTGLTDRPPVQKELKPIIDWLRDEDGCTFEMRGAGRVRVYHEGTPVTTIKRVGDTRGIKNVQTALRRLGLLQGYGSDGRRKKRRAPRPAEGDAAQAPPPLTTEAPRAQQVDAPPEPPAEEPPPPAPPPPPEPTLAEDPPPLGPRDFPHRARYYKNAEWAGHVRHRVLRVLHALGGNTPENRNDFVDFAIKVARERDLRIPAEGGTGKTSHEDAARNSIWRLTERGAVRRTWVLRFWETACDVFEDTERVVVSTAPPPPPPAPAETASVGIGWAERIADEERRVGQRLEDLQRLTMYQAALLLRRDVKEIRHLVDRRILSSELYEGHRVIRPAALAEAGLHRLPEEEPPDEAAATIEVVAETAPEPKPEPRREPEEGDDEIAARRQRYLDALEERALAGDRAAALRLERLLGLR